MIYIRFTWNRSSCPSVHNHGMTHNLLLDDTLRNLIPYCSGWCGTRSQKKNDENLFNNSRSCFNHHTRGSLSLLNWALMSPLKSQWALLLYFCCEKRAPAPLDHLLWILLTNSRNFNIPSTPLSPILIRRHWTLWFMDICMCVTQRTKVEIIK